MTEISIKHLSKSFDSKVALSGVNLDIANGESVAVIGASGSGKSVFIKCIIGLLVPDIGSSIIIDGQEVGNKHIAERKQMSSKFSMLFQGNALFDSLNVWQNIVFGMMQSKNLTKDEAKEIAISKLKMVELDTSIIKLGPSEISGGMQKRVALARALATNPEVIILDEPTSGLDPATAKIISNLIKHIHKELKITVLTVTHDVKCMRCVADKVIVVEENKIGWHGKISDVERSTSTFLKDFIEV
ncbi:phospholipid/cholesterol/gamma-HCH transport system ATP-binding protein [Alphaproteobacteria bacterium]